MVGTVGIQGDATLPGGVRGGGVESPKLLPASTQQNMASHHHLGSRPSLFLCT